MSVGKPSARIVCDSHKHQHYGNFDQHTPYNEGVFVSYWGYDRSVPDPRYPFGFGLSYATFTYSGLTIENGDDAVTVSFYITNTGKMDGPRSRRFISGRSVPLFPGRFGS